jgi:hypothetical protein
MAKRFGGEYSPGGDPRPADEQAPARRRPTRRKRLHPVGTRVYLLFMLPFLWAFSAFFRDAQGLAQHLVVFGLMMLSAWLTREGEIAQDAFDQRRVARRPAIPRKLFAAVIMAAALALAGWGSEGGVLYSVIFAVLGFVLHLGSFGLDPMRDKGMEGIDEFQTDRVARAVEGAEDHLAAMSDAILRARDRKVEKRLQDFQGHVRDLLRAVEDDPANLSSARRYMGVYLQGARDATVKFADIFERNRDTQARDEYIDLLDDLEENFMLRTETLRDSDRQQLDIEIDVLRERLEREGLRAPEPDPN